MLGIKRIAAITVSCSMFLALLCGCTEAGVETLMTTIMEDDTAAVLEIASDVASDVASDYLEEGDGEQAQADVIDLESLPAFDGKPYIVINGNVPFFKDDEFTSESFEEYSELDGLGRCGVCTACVGLDIMPDEERGAIGMVKPTGWHTVKYDCVEGKYLFNRCHLLGYQLTGENANRCNLITGTRYMNVEGMLPFENEVANYVYGTGCHVMYRVTPIFDGSNLLASGVIMEAESVEDAGVGVRFCVYCYNAQPGIELDYSTGESWEK